MDSHAPCAFAWTAAACTPQHVTCGSPPNGYLPMTSGLRSAMLSVVDIPRLIDRGSSRRLLAPCVLRAYHMTQLKLRFHGELHRQWCGR